MKDFIASLTDLVFPPRCSGCALVIESPAHLNFCPSCMSLVRRVVSPLCSCCGIPFPGETMTDHLCGECTFKKPPFELARAWAYYESALLKAIHQFKYQSRVFWGKMLGRVMAEATYPGFSFTDFSLVIPVPLHRKRLRERGFNQSLLLARAIASFHRLRLDFDNFNRLVYTEEQTRLAKEERRQNVRGAFSVKDKSRIKGERIILIDDVYTTGSTVKECSRILLDSQAEMVAVLTAARAV